MPMVPYVIEEVLKTPNSFWGCIGAGLIFTKLSLYFFFFMGK
jgi:hypothetical protein